MIMPIDRTFARIVGRIMSIALMAVALCILALAGFLLVASPGRMEPFLDKAGKPLEHGISEKIFVDIGGMKQGLFIKGKDSRRPVLLYLHGGLPDYFLTKKYPTGLEDYFTVVWWEQRGSGLSYGADIQPNSITLERMISDTLEMTNYLRRRFGQDKIYLMGHSGGSFIGIQAAARAPELYYAYIGVAQMSNQLKSEMLAYDYMLQRFKENGNLAMARKLEAAPVSIREGTPHAYLVVRDQAMHSLGIGTMRDMRSVITGILLPSLAFREYTIKEKLNLWTGKARSGVSSLWDTMLATDLATTLPELKIPVYFFHGIQDYTCSYSEAKSYFNSLKAPMKGFYTFGQSAHSPLFEEPEKMQKILATDLLHGGNSLADVK
jgi:pimeloyl-ACP methyl ester carboxylesterase